MWSRLNSWKLSAGLMLQASPARTLGPGSTEGVLLAAVPPAALEVGLALDAVDREIRPLIEFVGEKGTLWVARGKFLESDPPEIAASKHFKYLHLAVVDFGSRQRTHNRSSS